MKILVQKFGGTSVATEQRRQLVVEKILRAKREGYSPVVVVSAMGRVGQPYATDTLKSMVNSISKELHKRELDMAMSVGEILSCCVLCANLNSRGCICRALTGGQAGIITDDNYGEASVLKVHTDEIYKLLQDGVVPVVAGFQGVTGNGEITTLGRGGSDTTAAVLGEALRAVEIQIYTDVDGIMTADPRIVPDAKVIESMGYNEVFQFADQGAKVIHPRAVEFAMRGNVPLTIKNTMTDSPGTLITNYYEDGMSKRIVTGITHMPKRTQVHIESYQGNYVDDEKVFTSLADSGISIDLINVFPDYKIFTVDDDCTEKTELILKDLNIKYTTITNCSKVSIIGEAIRGVPGVMARIIKALRKNNVEILQTSDSHTTIWCLVKSEDTTKSIIALHDEFKLSR